MSLEIFECGKVDWLSFLFLCCEWLVYTHLVSWQTPITQTNQEFTRRRITISEWHQPQWSSHFKLSFKYFHSLQVYKLNHHLQFCKAISTTLDHFKERKLHVSLYFHIPWNPTQLQYFLFHTGIRHHYVIVTTFSSTKANLKCHINTYASTINLNLPYVLYPKWGT